MGLGSRLFSSRQGVSTTPRLVPLPRKMCKLPTSKPRKNQEGQMQAPNSAPLALAWILMTEAAPQSVRIWGAGVPPAPATTCQQEKRVNFPWLFFRPGYCTLMNNQKATSWKITGPLTALVLNLPCTFSYVLPLIADIISAWPPLWHQLYSNIAVSSRFCSSPCFPGLFCHPCLTCQSSPSLPPPSQPIRWGHLHPCAHPLLARPGSSVGFGAGYSGGCSDGVAWICDLCVLHTLIASRNLSLWQCLISRHFACPACAVSEDEWPIHVGSASHPDMLTYNADRLEREMKDSSRDWVTCCAYQTSLIPK